MHTYMYNVPKHKPFEVINLYYKQHNSTLIGINKTKVSSCPAKKCVDFPSLSADLYCVTVLCVSFSVPKVMNWLRKQISQCNKEK